MGLYAPYAVAETEATKWKPGEKLAASAFVAMTLLLVLEITIGVWRLFKRKQGLYFWSMTLALLGIVIDASGIIVKYFFTNPLPLWPLYTFLLVGGWSIYAPAELLVLYSRLHLVNQSRRLQRLVLAMITASVVFLIFPTWIIAWPAEDPRLSSLWSPRKGFVDRITQTGFTLIESAVGVIYVWSVFKLLRSMRSPLQRRVMHDLLYIAAIGVCLDIVVIVLVYTNQLGLSHPIQSFSYIVKLKLEFIVLNQLMAVAEKGLKKHSFEERKYCEPWTDFTVKTDGSSKTGLLRQSEKPSLDSSSSDTNLLAPNRVFSKQPTSGSHPRTNRAKHEEPDDQAYRDDLAVLSPKFTTKRIQGIQNEDVAARGKLGAGPNRRFLEHGTYSVTTDSWPLCDAVPHHQPRNFRAKIAVPASPTRHEPPGERNRNGCDDDENEIGAHMWENRGKLVIQAPWFRKENEI